MAQDVGSSGAGTNVQDDFSIDSAMTDGPSDQKETRWQNDNWSDWLGYFNEVPEFNAVVTALAKWTVGKGAKSEEDLSSFRGNGTDTFNTLMKNGVMTSEVGGDYFAEIIRNDGTFKKIFTWFGIINPGKPVNLKPLDPGTIVIVSDGKGFIKRYEQISKIQGKTPRTFKPEKMFHVPRNRFADNVHGTSLTEKLVKIILSRNESMDDYKQVQHRFVKPRWIIKLNTDDTTKINAEKTKWDKANADGENMYIPMGSVEAEQMAIPEGSTLNPLAWQKSLNDNFYLTSGVPKVILGEAGGTAEAGVKMEYFAFQQTIEEKQLFWEEQVEAQLGIKINFEPPASLEKNLNRDEKKDGGENAVKDNEKTASLEGKR